MKKINFFSIMAAVCAVMMTMSCTKDDLDMSLRDGDEGEVSAFLKQKSQTTDTRVIFNDFINEDEWYVKVGRFVDDKCVDSLDRTIKLGGIDVELYRKDTTLVSEPGFSHEKFFPNGTNPSEYNSDGIRRVEKYFVHNLDVRKDNQVIVSYNEGRVTLMGLTVESPDREAKVNYTGEDKVSPKYVGSDKAFTYYDGQFRYELTAKTLKAPRTYTATLCEKVAKTPDPKIINKKVGDKGFEPKTYFDNGNLKTGRSWMKIIDVWDDGHETEEPIKEEILNFWQSAPGYATEYPNDLTVSQMGDSMGSEAKVGDRNGSTSEISVKRMEKVYSTGLNAGGRNYGKSFTLGREIATWSDGTYTFEMPTAEYTGVYVSGFKSPSMDNLTENGVTYERKLNTIDVAGKIAGGNLKLQAQTELRKSKADPKIINKKVGDKGFEPKTYFDNGNLKTGRSWMKIIDVWDDGHETEEPTKEEILNFWQNAPGYATEYPSNLTVSQMGDSMGSEAKVGDRNGSTSEISVKRMEKVYSTGLNAGGRNYGKSFTLGREIATWSDGTYTFEMPTAEYTGVYVSGFKSPSMDNLTENGVTYERKLNTIDVAGKIAGGNLKLQAQTELRVKKADEPETFTETATYVGAKPIAANTVYVWAWIRRTSSKGGSTEFERGINLSYYGESDAETEFLVKAFSNESDWYIASVGIAQPAGSAVPNGDFMVQLWKRVVTLKDKKNNISRNITLYFERADVTLMNNGTLAMPYVFFTGDVLQKVDIKGMTQTTSSNTEYQRQRYVLTLGETVKAQNPSSLEFRNQFADTPVSFTTSAILKVAKEQEEERETPSWLGDPVDGRYTRVQKTVGAEFEDMLAFKYQKGVVLMPNGNKAKMIIFAFNQADADKYGVELAAESQWYSAAWNNGRWIPAMIRDNVGREDKAIDDDSKLKSWTYKGRGVAHTVAKSDALEKGIGYECTPVPHRQSAKIEGKTIVVSYYKNNTEKTTASLSLR